MKVLRAFNAASERILSPRLFVVDAAREPGEVRKIFVKGLPAQARNGVWLVNFETAPALRPESALDVIYLDEEGRVLHAVEISTENEFEPFKGQSPSVLILPPKTIARSKTFTGDPITIDQIENQSSEYIQASSSDSPAKPSKGERDTRSLTPPVSGPIRPSIPRRADPPAAAKITEIRQEKAESKEVPSSRAATPSVPEVSPGARRSIAPIPRDFASRSAHETPAEPEFRPEPKQTIAPTPSVPVPVIREAPSKSEQPLVTHSFPANRVESLEPAKPPLPKQAPIEFRPQDPAKSSNQSVKRNDQRQTSSSGPDPDSREGLDRLSKKIRSLLSRAEKIDPKMRRAPRFNQPGYVAYYFAGGPSTPHEIRNISAVGFYMVTDERWMVGTVIRVTLQKTENDAKDPSGISALARVVRWDSDGGGFEFVFPERND
jgi:hypothetical protein